VIALTDAQGPFFAPREQAFPDATDEQWGTIDAFDPGAVTADGRWWLRFRCFAVRDESGAVTLIDAGIGPADSPAAAWAPVPGRLPAELATVGIDPSDVRTVVLTHLHTDHIGWAVTRQSRVWRPYFPQARYVLQRNELDAIDSLNPRLRAALIDPLRATDQLSIIDGDEKVSPELSIVATPGHTPGHQSVLWESGDDLVAVTGDLLVHALQLRHPRLAYSQETDADLAATSRLALLDRVAAGGGLLATPHLTEPFLSVP
ncbi:MAG: MBL fold metallo-hydrolase, partial [Stackebrandtia sp.]